MAEGRDAVLIEQDQWPLLDPKSFQVRDDVLSDEIVTGVGNVGRNPLRDRSQGQRP
jgi:hypothetical protein